MHANEPTEADVLTACTAATYAYRPWNLELVGAEAFTTKSGGRRGLQALMPPAPSGSERDSRTGGCRVPAELHYGR